MKVAVVRNRDNAGIIARAGQTSPERYGRKSVQRIIDALQTVGHRVELFEGDMSLLHNLSTFFQTDAATGLLDGVVFNLAYGIQGESRYTHVPAMLEMAGVPYTGAGPLGHAVSLDKVIARTLMGAAGIPTPRAQVMASADEDLDELCFPLVVKPRHESSSYGLFLVREIVGLREAVQAVTSHYHQDALVEEYISGPEVYAGLLGDDVPEVLPLVELDFGDREIHLATWADKFHKNTEEPEKLCPAPLDEGLARQIRDIALKVHEVCHCRDYARLDIRVDRSGRPFVLEVNSFATLGWGGSYVLAAKHAGYGFPQLVDRLVGLAYRRYVRSKAKGMPGGINSGKLETRAAVNCGKSRAPAQQSAGCRSVSDRLTPATALPSTSRSL